MTDFFETLVACDPEPETHTSRTPARTHLACNVNVLAEEWRLIPGWPEYEVSSYGRVRRAKAGQGCVSGRVLKPWISVGYRYVCLWRENRRVGVAVHRLVALAFLPEPEPGQTQVAHGNGDGLDSRPENLRWATPTENASDKHIHGTDNRGERNHRSRLTAEIVRQIRQRSASGLSHREVAEQFGISRATVSDIANRRRWGHLE